MHNLIQTLKVYFSVPQNGLLTTEIEIREWDLGICILIIVPDNF